MEEHRGRKISLTRAVEKKFLEILAQGETVKRAATLCGFVPSTFFKRRLKNPAFAEEWEKVSKLGCKAVEEEIKRRGIHGWEEPVFYLGKQVGTITKYSDKLAEIYLKHNWPEKYNTSNKLAIDVTSSDGSMIPRAVQIATEEHMKEIRERFELLMHSLPEFKDQNAG